MFEWLADSRDGSWSRVNAVNPNQHRSLYSRVTAMSYQLRPGVTLLTASELATPCFRGSRRETRSIPLHFLVLYSRAAGSVLWICSL